MKLKKGSLYLLIIGAAFSFFFFLGLGKGRPSLVSQPAPNFKISDLEGKVHTLSDYRGKILLINFWATWCPPCRAEIPDFIEIYATEKDNGLAILGLSVDNLSPQELRDFVRRFKINYPIALATEEIIRDFQPGQYIPTTIFIDKNGQIRYKHVGLLNKDTLLNYFRKLKAEN
ncbi:MAG: TlpA family protein disulfide reductase [Candidatus Aminicenantes bacterium]|nr:TlpA family protein disulfide reductase [Candidatus Aminicenantes bacterium]